MTGEQFALGLKNLPDECRLSGRRAASSRAYYKRTAIKQKIQLAIGRLTIDAARAARVSQIADRQVRN